MNKDLVKRLAIQSGIDLEFFQSGELFQFSTAIAKQAVEDYKARLVPVSCIVSSNYCKCNLQKLYELGETK